MLSFLYLTVLEDRGLKIVIEMEIMFMTLIADLFSEVSYSLPIV